MPRFRIAYWAPDSAPWRPFTGAVEASGPREAIEKVAPQAVGRYRVTEEGSEETAGLFRVEVTPNGCELLEVQAFYSGSAAREADTDRAADAGSGVGPHHLHQQPPRSRRYESS